jgi:tetratricopeptide (TPR) repeat protein
MPSNAASERLASLEAYLRQDPDNPALRAEAVMAALESGALDRAQALLDAAAAPSDPQLLHARGLVALAGHRFADAARDFSDLLSRNVDAPAIRFNLAYAKFRAGDAAGAAQAFRDLLGVEGAPVQTLAYLVRCLHGLGKPEAAIEAWESAAPVFRTAQTGGVVSLACLDAGQADEARRLSGAALAGEEPPLEAMVTGATLLVGDGDVAQAGRWLDMALAASPDDGRIWSAIGAATLLSGDIVRAEAAFQRACERLPEHVGSWISLAWCQIMRKDLDGAGTSLDEALARDRNFAETHGSIAVVAALQGRVGDAEQAIEKAQRLDRKGLSARYAQAVLSGEASDAAAIQALAARLLRARPGPDGAALLERTLAAARQGRR